MDARSLVVPFKFRISGAVFRSTHIYRWGIHGHWGPALLRFSDHPGALRCGASSPQARPLDHGDPNISAPSSVSRHKHEDRASSILVAVADF